MRKETKNEAERSNIFDQVKGEKAKALKVLAKAKKQEVAKIKQGYVYVTSTDGKSKTLKKVCASKLK